MARQVLVTDRWSTRLPNVGPGQQRRDCPLRFDTFCWAWRANCYDARGISRRGRELT